MELSNFKEIVKNYKVVFFDAYGVLKTYKGILDGVKEMLAFLQSQSIEFYILTNDASRSPELLAASYNKVGIHDITTDKIISSGMLAQEYVQHKVKSGTVVYLGTHNSAYYIKQEGVKALSISEVDFLHLDEISAIVFLDDEGYNWNEDLNKVLNLLRKTAVPVVIANTDSTYPIAKQDVAISVGAIADMLERIARKTFIRFGKPDSQIFNYAYNHIPNSSGIVKQDILMVGDSLTTDIIGANKFGIDTCLVLSGNTLSDNYKLMIDSLGIIPNYVCKSVAL